jgi:hypothetical protein
LNNYRKLRVTYFGLLSLKLVSIPLYLLVIQILALVFYSFIEMFSLKKSNSLKCYHELRLFLRYLC